MPTMKAVILSTLAASAIAGQATLTSVTPDNLVATATPGNVVYVFSPATALAATENFEFSHNEARYTDGTIDCTYTGSASSTTTTGTAVCTVSATGKVNTCVLATGAVIQAADTVTVTCIDGTAGSGAGAIAANGGAATVTTSLATSTDVGTGGAESASTIITAAPACTIPVLGNGLAAGTCTVGVGTTTLAAGASCTIVADTGYATSGTGMYNCHANTGSLTATSDLAVTGCLADYRQSAGTSATDGVCTVCDATNTAADKPDAAAFGGTATVCECTNSFTGADCETAGGATAVCTRPDASTGYDAPTADPTMMGDSADGAWPVTAGASSFASACATGYSGTVIAAACSSAGPYTLSGCTVVAAYAGEAGKWDNDGAATTCVAGDVALCTAHATLKVKKTADDLCPACNELSAAPAVTDAAGACMACPPYSESEGVVTGHFPNAAATAGCGDCALNCFACTSATVCTEAHSGYFLKDGTSPAVGVETCVAGDVALCTADATLKVLKSVHDLCPPTMSSDGSWTGSTLTATPAVTTAAQACKACEVGKFPNVADTASCGDCAANCDECTSATVCTAASAGFFLETTGEAVAPAACTAAADATLCTADATLKLAKTASDLCPAGNTLTATPAVAAAAGACKACAPGNTPEAAATAGCVAVAGKCAGNAATAADLAEEADDETFHFDCGCPMKMVLKPSADTIALSGADAAAKKAVCCAAYVAPVTTTVAATTAAPAAPSPAAAAAAAAGTAPSSGSLSDATAASMSTMILLVAAGIAAATSL